MRISFAQHSAWRAIYIYLANGQKIFHLGIDPTAGRGPICFGSIFGWAWRFSIPHLRYKPASGKIRTKLYIMSQRFWYSLDGRRSK